MQEQPQFKSGVWEVELNVRDFVSQNVTPYDGDSSFLSGPTEKTKRVWEHCLQALKEERENPHGVRSIDTSTISGITAFAPGYIDKDNEVIVGLQTDQVLRRAMKPFGGYKVVEKAVHENG
ncbi:MAG: formate acetyltransferase, partial [Porphyromonas sp.]|nr:formate acetyltransferase [Porphyromonas sp.]